MIRTLLKVFSAALFSAVLLASAMPSANAAAQFMCTSPGSRQVGGSGSQVPSGTLYTLNGRGCALIAQADIGYFASQGYTPGPSGGSFIFTTGVATGTTDFVIGSVPAGAAISKIIYSNAVAAAVTGGISVGTTANGTDVVAAQAVGSSALTFTTDALTLKRVFSLTTPTPLHAAAVTAWNSTNVTITVTWEYF